MTASDLGTPPVAGQRLTSDDGDYMLLFVEWEKKDDDALVGKLKQIMAGFRRDFGAGDFRSKLVGALRDEQMKHQKLSYFEATSWTPMNMQEIFNRNRTAKNKYRPDLLPTVNRPGKPSEETLNTRDTFEAYDIAALRADPPT